MWARAADPKEVEAKFKSLLSAVLKAAVGADLRPDKDALDQTRVGSVHTLAFNLQSRAPNAARSFEFIMQTVEHENAGFQAWIEVAPASPR